MKETTIASDPKLFLRLLVLQGTGSNLWRAIVAVAVWGRWRSCMKCYSQFGAQRQAVKELAVDGMGQREIGEVLGVDAIRR